MQISLKQKRGKRALYSIAVSSAVCERAFAEPVHGDQISKSVSNRNHLHPPPSTLHPPPTLHLHPNRSRVFHVVISTLVCDPNRWLIFDSLHYLCIPEKASEAVSGQ